MVRYLVSLNWDGFIRSTIVTAFEAYGSALVGITPFDRSVDCLRQLGSAKPPSAGRG